MLVLLHNKVTKYCITFFQASTSSAPQDASPSILFIPEGIEVVGENINVGPSLQVLSIPNPDLVHQPITTQPSQPAEPVPSTSSRRRRRRSAPMSQEMARRALVESSHLRAEATQEISTDLKNIVNVLSRIAAVLDTINNR